MAEYDNTNRGVAFENDDKQSDTHPDMKGSINVDGVEYWLSAWWKTPKSGSADFLSFSIKPKEERAPNRKESHPAPAPQSRGRGRPQTQRQAGGGSTDEDGDVPF